MRADWGQPDVIRNRLVQERADFILSLGLIRREVKSALSKRAVLPSEDAVRNRQPVLDMAAAGITDHRSNAGRTTAKIVGDHLRHAFVPKHGGLVHALVGFFGQAAVAGAEL